MSNSLQSNLIAQIPKTPIKKVVAVLPPPATLSNKITNDSSDHES